MVGVCLGTVSKRCRFWRGNGGSMGNGEWLLVIGYWLLVIGYWLSVIGYRLSENIYKIKNTNKFDFFAR